MRGQAADYDGWRQLGLTGWGWDDVLPYFMQATRTTHRRRTSCTAPAASGASNIPACAGTSSTRSATRPSRSASAKIDDFNTRRQRRLVLLPGEPEARPALERGARLPASPCSGGPTSGWRRACMAERVDRRRRPRDRAWSSARAACRRIARARGEVILAAGAIGSPHLLELSGIGDRREAAGARHRDGPRSPRGVGENLQDHLQIRPIFKVERRTHAQRGLPQLPQARPDGPRIRAVPQRPADHGALAARALHPLVAGLRHAEPANSTSSRSRSTSSAIRCTPFPPSRRACAICARPAAARSTR